MTTLSPLELAIMQSLWQRQDAPVRDVQEDLLPNRPLAYTTVMTVLDRLYKKGLVRRWKKSRAHVYQPTVSESEARAAAVEGLVDRFFGGSASDLKSYLAGGAKSPRPSVANPGPFPRAPEIDDTLL